MSKQCLDISQMQHLKELGIDTSKASACWFRVLGVGDLRVFTIWSLAFNKYITKTEGIDTQIVPTFTLQDILDLLPKEIDSGSTFFEHTFYLYVDYQYGKICYSVDIAYEGMFTHKSFSIDECKSLIDTAYEMLCWCIENGYVKTNKEN